MVYYRESSAWLKPFANDYQGSSSVEPVLSKRKEWADHFAQIFYPAFYATRLYLRKSPELVESPQILSSETKESSSSKVRGSSVSSERQSVEEIQPLGENLEIVREYSPEASVPIAQKDLPDNFQIFEDRKRLYEEIGQPMQEEITLIEAAGDPAIENKENFPPTEIEPVPVNPSSHSRGASQELGTNKYDYQIYSQYFSNHISGAVPSTFYPVCD